MLGVSRRARVVSGPEPVDRGMIAWTFDPALAVASGAPTSGTVTGGRLKHPGGTITGILACTLSPLVLGVAGQNFAGIYDVNGNRLALTADLTVPWATPGAQQMPLTAPIALPAQYLDIVIVSNHSGGAIAGFCRISGATSQYSCAPAGTAMRAFTADAAATALPAILGAKTVRPTPEWFGLY